MPTHTVRPKVQKNPKSSAAARRLIEAYVKVHKTERTAAKKLGLKNHAQLGRMRRGEMRDTPEMKAALIKADKRAKRAWALAPDLTGAPVDTDVLRAQLSMLAADVEATIDLLPKPP